MEQLKLKDLKDNNDFCINLFYIDGLYISRSIKDNVVLSFSSNKDLIESVTSCINKANNK